MKCLGAGRQSLKRTGICPGNFLSGVTPFFTACRQYALIPTPRRMRAHDQPTSTQYSDGSVPGTAASSQAQPLSGYYSLILESPSPYGGRATTAQSTTALPEDQPTTTTAAAPKEQTPQEKMAIVFGSRLAGPGRQSRYRPSEAPPESMWKTINGVPIPPRPEEPDNCCMSGCVNCVWDAFGDEVEEWAARVAVAKAKGGPEAGTADMRASPRPEVDLASTSMDDDGGGSETNWTAPSPGDDLFASIPVGFREFMKIEKKLRVKREKEAAA